MINGITFSERLMTSADFSHFIYTFLNHSNGITKGCEISHADGNIYVQKGYFMQFGRMIQILGTEEISTPDVLSGQLYCKVVFEIDLSKTNTENEFGQGYFKTLTGADDYPPVIQEDLDDGGTLHQIPWCQYIKGIEGITEFYDLRKSLEILSLNSLLEGLNQHKNSKNNPHGVTAEQVGAAPSGHTHTASEVGAAPSKHTHAVSDINSGTLPVSRGGTGATSFTSGQLLIGNGANAVTGRGVTDNTSMKTCSGTYIPTCNTVAQHAAAVLNRSNGVHNANTAYTTYMARGIALVTSAPSSLVNGCCAFVYQ